MISYKILLIFFINFMINGFSVELKKYEKIK